MNIESAKARSALYRNIRQFFDTRGYLEVDTPCLSPDLIPEPTIDNFGTTFINEFLGSRELYLIPSPEIFMKKLIAQGSGSVYQISKCFRNCEQLGKIHNPEFSMLEYYTLDADEKDSVLLTKELLGFLGFDTSGWIEMSVREAVIKYAGIDIEELQRASDLRKAAMDLHLHIPGPESWDDTFNRVFCTFVETSLPQDCPVLLYDYPKQINCLAERNGNTRRRWELYLNGIEVANCYLEERNPDTVREYYREEYSKLISSRSSCGKVIPDVDDNYADIFKSFPKCSGVAVGLDRLLMVLTGEKDINDVMLFPFASF